MIERKDSDLVMPGDEMRARLHGLDCHHSESQVQLVAEKAGVSDAAVRRAANGRTLYRREWNKLAHELGVIE